MSDSVFEIEGLPLPPSANNMFVNLRRGRRKSQRYIDWEYMAGYALNTLKPKHTIMGRVRVTYTFGEKGCRADSDLGNLEKAVSDLLVKHRVIQDDSKPYVRKIVLQWGDGDTLSILIEPFTAESPNERQASHQKPALRPW